MGKRCRAKPQTERRAIEDQDDIFRFLKPSHISEKNVIRLRQMEKSDNPQVATLAEIALEVARLKPYKTRRLKFLARKHPELLRKLEATGLIFTQTSDWENREVSAQSNSEEAVVVVAEDGEGTDSSAQEDSEIPF